VNQIDTLLVGRASSLLLTVWTVRPLPCQAGLLGRLGLEVARLVSGHVSLSPQ
jgi:hypothetical protein